MMVPLLRRYTEYTLSTLSFPWADREPVTKINATDASAHPESFFIVDMYIWFGLLFHQFFACFKRLPERRITIHLGLILLQVIVIDGREVLQVQVLHPLQQQVI